MKTIKIDNKEYTLDVTRATELGVLKEVNPCNGLQYISWKEYVNMMSAFRTIDVKWNNITPFSPEKSSEQQAFEALGKLIQLRDGWWGKWKPDWNDVTQTKYGIVIERDEPEIDELLTSQVILAFPTKEMAEEFYKYHKKLIETAKMFL